MRFEADGPSIPNELLEERDSGNVVFFCGAGVSKPVGLPSFPELAKQVMAALGTGAIAQSRITLEETDDAENLDRVFNLLQQETGEMRLTRSSTDFSRRRHGLTLEFPGFSGQ